MTVVVFTRLRRFKQNAKLKFEHLLNRKAAARKSGGSLFHVVFQAQQPVSGDPIKFAKRDYIPNWDFVLPVLISAILLLWDSQRFRNFVLRESGTLACLSKS